MVGRACTHTPRVPQDLSLVMRISGTISGMVLVTVGREDGGLMIYCDAQVFASPLPLPRERDPPPSLILLCMNALQTAAGH